MCCCYSEFFFSSHRVPQYFWRKQSSRTGQYIVVMSATSFACINNCMSVCECVCTWCACFLHACVCCVYMCILWICEREREREREKYLTTSFLTEMLNSWFRIFCCCNWYTFQREKKRFMCYSFKLIAFWKACRCMSVWLFLLLLFLKVVYL